jgi:hypothetical protein
LSNKGVFIFATTNETCLIDWFFGEETHMTVVEVRYGERSLEGTISTFMVVSNNTVYAIVAVWDQLNLDLIYYNVNL